MGDRSHQAGCIGQVKAQQVPGRGQFVLSADEIFAIDNARLKLPVSTLSTGDRVLIKPALDKVIGEY
ncbi:MAG: hypothetical protein WC029_13295 [Sulfuricella sp.]